MEVIKYTMVYPVIFNKCGDVKRIMLGRKKRGLGKGLLVGYGGKKKNGEDIMQTAARELDEETGFDIPQSALIPRGTMHYTFLEERNQIDHHMFIFLVDMSAAPRQLPRDCSEIDKHAWWFANRLPWHKMWPDNKFWLPMLVAGGTRLLGSAEYALPHKLGNVHLRNILFEARKEPDGQAHRG